MSYIQLDRKKLAGGKIILNPPLPHHKLILPGVPIKNLVVPDPQRPEPRALVLLHNPSMLLTAALQPKILLDKQYPRATSSLVR